MDGDKGDRWEPEINIPEALRENFEKGDRENMLTLWDISTMYGMTSVRSYQVTGKTEVASAKRRKITSDSSSTDRYHDSSVMAFICKNITLT